ncbi:hypothetical protein M1446_02340 [Candidatus Dependentiae bacterium]|nr:hypothetical protein [Candidatus Dependentiae bacterium]
MNCKNFILFFIPFFVAAKNKVIDVQVFKNMCDEIDIYFLHDPKFVREPRTLQDSEKKILLVDTEISKNLMKKINVKSKFYSVICSEQNQSIVLEIKFDEKKVLFRFVQGVSKEGLIYLKFRFCLRDDLEKNLKNSPYRLRA